MGQPNHEDLEKDVHEAVGDDHALLDELPEDDDTSVLGVEALTKARQERDAGETSADSVDPDFRDKLRRRLTEGDEKP